MKDLIEISVVYIKETQMAIGVTETEDFGEKLIWIPKSQISEYDGNNDKGDIINLMIPEWLAIEKELV